MSRATLSHPAAGLKSQIDLHRQMQIANPSPPPGSVMVGAGSPSRLGITPQ